MSGAGWWARWFRPKKLRPFLPAPCVAETGAVYHRGGGQEIDILAALRVPYARLTYYTQQAGEAYDAAIAAQLVALDAIGVEPLIVVHDFTPAYEFGRMDALVRRFAGRTWQLGNEYDAQPWRGAGAGGAAYADWMARVGADARLVDPTCRFVASGCATADGQALPGVRPDAARWAAWMRGLMSNASAVALLDAVAVHTYLDSVTAVAARVQAVHDVVRGRVPVWITEAAGYGLPQDDARQSAALRALVSLASRMGVPRLYAYCVWDDTDDGYGLVRKGGEPRPACDVVREGQR